MNKHISIFAKAVEKVNFPEAFLKENTDTVTTLPLLHDNVSGPDGISRTEVFPKNFHLFNLIGFWGFFFKFCFLAHSMKQKKKLGKK